MSNVHSFTQPNPEREAAMKRLRAAIQEMDTQAKKDPHTSSMIAGGVAVAGTYLAMTAAPALAVTGSIVWALWSVGNSTQKKTYKRWNKK